MGEVSKRRVASFGWELRGQKLDSMQESQFHGSLALILHYPFDCRTSTNWISDPTVAVVLAMPQLDGRQGVASLGLKAARGYVGGS